MLVLANPQDNLPEAGKEALFIKNSLDNLRDFIHVDLKITRIHSDYLKKNLRDYDLVHYAGHADYSLREPKQSGWVLEDGLFSAADILRLGESGLMPTLIFANACQSLGDNAVSQEQETEVYSLAQAFLLSGVRHYIATIAKVADEPARFFASEFYTYLIQGKSIGQALRLARLGLIKKYTEKQITWMSYVMFGDPTPSLLKEAYTLSFRKITQTPKRIFLRIGLSIAMATLLVYIYFYQGKFFACSERLFQSGRNAELIASCNKRILRFGPQPAALLRLGDVYERLGKRQAALEYYFQAAAEVSEKKLAPILIKIGWINYLLGNYANAFNFYNRALTLAQHSGDKLNEALALRKIALYHMDHEEYEKAMELLLLSSEINRSRQYLSSHRYNLACDYFNLALVFTDKEDLKAAKEFYDKSMRIFKELKLTSELSDYYANLAEIARFNKDYRRAEELYRKSIRIDEQLGNLPSLAATYSMMAELYWEMQDEERAEDYFKKSLEIEEKIEDPKGKAQTYVSLGLFYAEKNKKALALDYFKRAQEFYKNIDTPDYQYINNQIKNLHLE